MQNFYAQFAETAARVPSATAVEVQRPDSLEVVRYAELERMVGRVARWLAAEGCGAGDRCAILADNDATWCAAYLAIFRLGAVAVPFDTAYSAAQVETLLGDSQAGLVLTNPRLLHVAATAAAGLERKGVQCRVALLFGAAPGVRSLDALWQAPDLPGDQDDGLPPCPAGPSDPAVILYTSGTTADPKGVVLTHGNLLAERAAVFQMVAVDERDSVLGVLPLFHALAQVANLLLPFAAGARVVFLERVNTGELMRALTERDITAFVCVPQFFYLIHRRVMAEVAAAGRLERFAFRRLLSLNGRLRSIGGINLGRVFFGRVHQVLGPRMRLLITGGSRFDPAIARDLHHLGFDILQAYGLTECAGAATLTRPGDRHFDSVGRALPGIELRVLPARTAGDERDGEILIRGPIVMAGYHARPDATAAVLDGGWLHTGDLGRIDAAGRLGITGRSKEVIVLASGKNIYPEEVEAHYGRSPFVKELCVLGLTRAGEPSAERLFAVVVPDLDVMRDRHIVNMREILRFEIDGRSVDLPSHKRIQGYDVRLDPLPRTTTGKLKRFEIERSLTAKGSGAPAPDRRPAEEDGTWASEAHVSRALDAIAAAVPAGTTLVPDANLEIDLGLDSMERVELLARLEAVFRVRVDRATAQSLYTVRELVDAVRPSGEPGSAATASHGDVWTPLLDAAPETTEALRDLLVPRTVLASVLFALAKLGFALASVCFRLEVRGRDRLPPTGPCLISPNHQSFLDAFLLVCTLPFGMFRNLFFVGASEYFESPLRRRLARLVHIVPVDPDSNLLRAMQAGAFGLRNGKVLILFPEGERSIDGEPKAFKKGAAILSAHLGVPIVPVAIDGLYEVWPRGRGFRWRALLPWVGPRVRYQFGAPIPPPPLPSHDAPAPDFERTYESTTSALERAVRDMFGN
jgi:long-chain acyl-CoA synthetase